MLLTDPVKLFHNLVWHMAAQYLALTGRLQSASTGAGIVDGIQR